MSQSDLIRWGVIGLGYFGEVHAHTLSTMPGIQLAALCTRRDDRLRQVAELYTVEKLFNDYHQLLADPSIDAVSLTTNVDDHRNITIEALRNGKHVLVEKPMAPTVADCDQMIEAAQQNGRLLMVGHICRFDPRVTMAKRAIDDKRIGDILSMNARRNLSKAIGVQAGEKVSALFGHGIHDADIMLWFNRAQPVSVYAQESHPSAAKYPDCGWATLRFANGAVGVIEEVWHLPETTRFDIDARMEVIGTKGALHQLWRYRRRDPRCPSRLSAGYTVLAQHVREWVGRSVGNSNTLPTASGRAVPRTAVLRKSRGRPWS